MSFIEDYNTKLKFTFCEKWLFIIVKTFYAPLAKEVHHQFRKKKFIALQQSMYIHFSPQFWGDKDDNKSLRLGCSKDF